MYPAGNYRKSLAVLANMSAAALHLLSELKSCVKVEVAVLGSPSLILLKVSVDVKQH